MMRGLLFLLLLVSGCSGRRVKTIVIRGSDTEVNLVLIMAERFMDADPDVSIAVTGGGSGTGIASLINKKTDIANSSRAFTASEIQLATERGVDIIPIVFAVDALSFIVHPSNPIDSLRIDQIRSIYTGRESHWHPFGGSDLPISLYGRQGNSGTFTFIQQNILRDDYTLDMKQMNGTSQIIESIKNDRAGIGYVGIGYVANEEGEVIDGVKVLKIQGEGQSVAVSPTDTANILDGTYPIIRPLYQYLDGLPSGKLRSFLWYELSPEGQRIISENGYFPVSQAFREQNDKYLNRE